MRALLLICLIGSLVVVLAPANAQVVRCQDGVFRGASDCPGARQALPAIKTEAPRPAAPVRRADAEDLARVAYRPAASLNPPIRYAYRSSGRTPMACPDSFPPDTQSAAIAPAAPPDSMAQCAPSRSLCHHAPTSTNSPLGQHDQRAAEQLTPATARVQRNHDQIR